MGALGEPSFLCPVGRRCGWGISCMVIKRGCWSVWRLWAGCRWYLPVVRVAPSLYQQVRAPSRLRALGRLAEYGWALQERSWIEQVVFGGVKGAYGSYMGCRRVAYVRVRVWGSLVLWNMVPYLRVGGGGVFCCVWGVVVVWYGVGRGIFEHPLATPEGVRKSGCGNRTRTASQGGAWFPCPAKTASKPRSRRDFSNTLCRPLDKRAKWGRIGSGRREELFRPTKQETFTLLVSKTTANTKPYRR